MQRKERMRWLGKADIVWWTTVGTLSLKSQERPFVHVKILDNEQGMAMQICYHSTCQAKKVLHFEFWYSLG